MHVAGSEVHTSTGALLQANGVTQPLHSRIRNVLGHHQAPAMPYLSGRRRTAPRRAPRRRPCRRPRGPGAPQGQAAAPGAPGPYPCPGRKACDEGEYAGERRR